MLINLMQLPRPDEHENEKLEANLEEKQQLEALHRFVFQVLLS